MICKPIGRPPAKPHGTTAPGNPARLSGSVRTSARYISIGLPDFSPSLKAVVGVVGQTITVQLNGKVVTEYTAHKNVSGCVGIQSMKDFHVHFRDIHVVELKRDEKAIPVEGL